jgi:hypothetical protein
MRTDELSCVDKRKLKRAQKSAWKEIVWFFGKMEGCVPEEGEGVAGAREAAMKIQAWFAAIANFNAGALELRFKRRAWPEAIRKEFGDLAGIISRIECAQHPSDRIRTEEELEQESIRRLLEMMADKRCRSELYDMVYRVKWHVRSAHKAYVKVRGWGPCVLPKSVARSIAMPPEA